MADPLSITLAVVTLAAALKEIVELGEKVEGSFAKVSHNLRNAQRLASEIHETLHRIESFCDQHSAIFLTESAITMRGALENLLAKMTIAYTSCCELVPPSSKKMIGRIQVWRRRNKIETAIAELRKDVDRCLSEFTMFFLLDIGRLYLQRSHKEMSENIVNAQLPFPVVPGQAIYLHPPPNLSLGTPLMVRKCDIEDLRLEVKYLGQAMSKLRIGDLVRNFQRSKKIGSIMLGIPSFQPGLYLYQGGKSNLCRHTMSFAIEIRNLLQAHSTTMFLERGELLMNNLAVGLSCLNMHTEAVDPWTWTVKLCRVTNTTNQVRNLIYELGNLSIAYRNSGDLNAASTTIEEGVEIGRRLILQVPPSPLDLRLQYGNILAEQARVADLQGDRERSREIAEEAVSTFERNFQIDTESFAHRRVEGILEVDPMFLEALGRASRGFAIFRHNYACALHQLSISLHHNGLIQESTDCKMKAVAILTDLFQWNPDSSIDLLIGFILYDLVILDDFTSFLPQKKLLRYAEKTYEIYHKYALLYPSQYCQSLCNPLFAKAAILWRMGDLDRALNCWKEIAKLAGEHAYIDALYAAKVLCDISRGLAWMGYHEEAISISNEAILLYENHSTAATIETEALVASLYLNLAGELCILGSYNEAIISARSAVARHKSLASKGSKEGKYGTAHSLQILAKALFRAGFCEEALTEGQEALEIYEDLALNDDCNVVPRYVACLWDNDEVALNSDNKDRAIERSRYIVRAFLKLAKAYPDTVILGVARAHLHLARNLHRFDHVTNAAGILERLLQEWDKKYGPPEDGEPVTVKLYMWCLFSYSNVLHSQGRTADALKSLDKSIALGDPLSRIHPSIATATAASMARRVLRLSELGRIIDARNASNDAIAFGRSVNLEHTDDFVCCLQSVAWARRHCASNFSDTEAAVIKTTINICERPVFFEYSHHNRYALFELPDSLIDLSMNFANVGKEPDALQYAEEAVKVTMNLKLDSCMLSWMDMKPKYMDARWNLAICLAAKGDLVRALDELVKLETYHKSRARTRIISNVSLGDTLHVISILFCAVGRHDEGARAASDLAKLKSCLDDTYPDVLHQLGLQLVHSSTRLKDVRGRLKCHHQDNR